MIKKEHLKDSDLTSTFFTAFDYVLCAGAFSLIAAATVPQIAFIIAHLSAEIAQAERIATEWKST